MHTSTVPSWLASFVSHQRRFEPDELLSEVVVALLTSPACPGRDAHGFPTGPFARQRAVWAVADLLRRVARRLAREVVTSPDDLPSSAAYDAPDAFVARSTKQRNLIERLADLPAADRRLTALRLAGGLAEREVADVLAMAPSTVHRRWAAIRCELMDDDDRSTG